MSGAATTAEAMSAAFLESVRELLLESHAAFRDAARELSPEALAWRPPAPQGNSVTALICHALESERYLLSAALDRHVERDREAQFERVVGSPQELLDDIDAADRLMEELLGAMTPTRLVAPSARRATRTGAGWLLRAVAHGREHAGQALLTHDLALAALATR